MTLQSGVLYTRMTQFCVYSSFILTQRVSSAQILESFRLVYSQGETISWLLKLLTFCLKISTEMEGFSEKASDYIFPDFDVRTRSGTCFHPCQIQNRFLSSFVSLSLSVSPSHSLFFRSLSRSSLTFFLSLSLCSESPWRLSRVLGHGRDSMVHVLISFPGGVTNRLNS